MKALAAIVLGFLSLGKCDEDEQKIPACMHTRIEEIKSEDVWNPAATVWRITTTKNETYYYIPPHCCDFFGELYDKDCNPICAPDGGITGKGSGDCPDYEIKKNVLVWKDKRGE